MLQEWHVTRHIANTIKTCSSRSADEYHTRWEEKQTIKLKTGNTHTNIKAATNISFHSKQWQTTTRLYTKFLLI